MILPSRLREGLRVGMSKLVSLEQTLTLPRKAGEGK
jgi:hypothetical protein